MSSARSSNQRWKYRKHTYLVRKEEKENLNQEIDRLSAQVEALKQQRMSPQEQFEAESQSMAQAMNVNVAMRTILRTQQQMLCGANAMLVDWMNTQCVSPLASFIHLPVDAQARQQTLLAMKTRKIQTAEQFLHLNNRSLDPLEPYSSKHQCESSRGDLCGTRFDIVQFDGSHSVRQVYDALLFSLYNMEIGISEKMGEITVREDLDTLQQDEIWNYRLLAQSAQGPPQEMNCATFAQFNTETDCGIVVSDFIDQDDLYPYEPSKRVRRDVSATGVLRAYRRRRVQPSTTGSWNEYNDEMVVVFQHAFFESVHHTDVPMDDCARSVLQASINRWGDVILSGLRDRLATI